MCCSVKPVEKQNLNACTLYVAMCSLVMGLFSHDNIKMKMD